MSRSEEAPDVDQLARSMLRLYGAHDDDDDHGHNGGGGGSWSKPPNVAADPDRAAADTGHQGLKYAHLCLQHCGRRRRLERTPPAGPCL